MQKRRTSLKKLQRFHFLLFSRTTGKTPSIFTRIFGIQSCRLSSDSNEHQNFTICGQNHRISPFSDVYDIFGPKWHPKFHKNPTFWAKIHGSSLFWDVYGIFGPKLHPEIHKRELGSTFLVRGRPPRARPARRASPAAWSRLAARWAALREGEEGRAQGRGSAEERLEPPHSYHRRWVIWCFHENDNIADTNNS